MSPLVHHQAVLNKFLVQVSLILVPGDLLNLRRVLGTLLVHCNALLLDHIEPTGVSHALDRALRLLERSWQVLVVLLRVVDRRIHHTHLFGHHLTWKPLGVLKRLSL